MERYERIGIKRVVFGMILSIVATGITIWSILRFAGPVSQVLAPCAASLATFICMSRAVRLAAKESHDAVEVGRRLPVGEQD